MSGFERVWKDRGMSVNTKVKLVRASYFLQWPGIGARHGHWGKAMKIKISAFEMWCWRRLLRIEWTAKRSNSSILAEIKEEMSLVHKVLKLKLTYFGDVVRSDGLEKTFMFGIGKVYIRGRPRRRWLDEVVETRSL